MDASTKDRPIIFSARMVRALLDGRKTQTRRINKIMSAIWPHQSEGKSIDVAKMDRHTPYGTVGTRLYVREATGHVFTTAEVAPGCPAGCRLVYRADEPDAPVRKWRPSIHMPRWASRLTLTITDVRVERVKDISGHDAQAEGVEPCDVKGHDDCFYGASGQGYKCAFEALWNSIHGPGAWERNDWVWALTFTTEVRK